MLTSDLRGLRVYLAVPQDKQVKKDGSPREPKKLGRIHFPVFAPQGRRVVGFMVKRPDVAGMIKQEDRFVALDALRRSEDGLMAADIRESFDAPAAKRLGLDLDRCLIWVGMDVFTESGKKLGYCADASFDPKSGAVDAFVATPSSASSALIGQIEMPAELLRGYREGCMIVADEASQIGFSGGAAAKAAEATVHAGAAVKKGASKLDEKGSQAVERGSKALGERIGKTGDAFKDFKSEYQKAAGTGKKAPSKPASSTAAAKPQPKPKPKASAQQSGAAARAVGRQLGAAGGMFKAFASEFKKASGSSSSKRSKS